MRARGKVGKINYRWVGRTKVRGREGSMDGKGNAKRNTLRR